ncbi:MAG: TldD/PmbA family protein [Candidatus Aminicenantes bacterium]|nr:TldD/PmbA family protein [Candidatus Aminicenantes bacterium]
MRDKIKIKQLLNDTFNLSEEIIQKVLNSALSKGGEFSELFLEYKVFTFIKMEDDIIKETAESIDLGAGIRVISGDKTGYGYTNNLSLNDMQKAALTAAQIASGGHGKNLAGLFPIRSRFNLYPAIDLSHKASFNKKIDIVKRAYTTALDHDPKIIKVNTALTDQIQNIVIANSDGLLISDQRPLVKLTCMAIAEKNGQREAGFYGGGGRVGLDYFQNVLTAEEIGRESSQEALHLLEAVLPPGGEMPVILTPGHSGVLIHEAVGHLLEADFIRKKTSIFWNKLGKKVGTDQVTIFDDPTIPFFRGSYNLDDEGTIPEKTCLISKGIVTGFLQDKLSAKIMGQKANGHGRRQDYSCFPIPRMSNTYIDAGEFTPEEILKSVKKGFYALRFQGGQVEDSGKFVFSVSSGYLIEEGRKTAPVKQASLIGSNIDILNKIEMVGSDLDFGLQTGICGKEGQGIPVNDGCPTLKISAMTVGGIR